MCGCSLYLGAGKGQFHVHFDRNDFFSGTWPKIERGGVFSCRSKFSLSYSSQNFFIFFPIFSLDLCRSFLFFLSTTSFSSIFSLDFLLHIPPSCSFASSSSSASLLLPLPSPPLLHFPQSLLFFSSPTISFSSVISSTSSSPSPSFSLFSSS